MISILRITIIILIIQAACVPKRNTSENNIPIVEDTEINQSTDFSEQSTWLLGYFPRERLSTSPYSEWFIKGYDEYIVDKDAVNRLDDVNKNDITIKIVLGTWCPDSRREVPRFMHILDYWDFPKENITFIGVDDMKDSPLGEYAGLGIERVPTFIFYDDNIELGRIIENPVTSLEKDMVEIITRNE